MRGEGGGRIYIYITISFILYWLFRLNASLVHELIEKPTMKFLNLYRIITKAPAIIPFVCLWDEILVKRPPYADAFCNKYSLQSVLLCPIKRSDYNSSTSHKTHPPCSTSALLLRVLQVACSFIS